MSMRRGQTAEAATAAKVATFRAGLEQARAAQQSEEATTALNAEGLAFDDLTETEKSAALVGASPNDLNPIGFINEAHYNTLRTKNALASDLAQKIEARGPLSPLAPSLICLPSQQHRFCTDHRPPCLARPTASSPPRASEPFGVGVGGGVGGKPSGVDEAYTACACVSFFVPTPGLIRAATRTPPPSPVPCPGPVLGPLAVCGARRVRAKTKRAEGGRARACVCVCSCARMGDAVAAAPAVVEAAVVEAEEAEAAETAARVAETVAAAESAAAAATQGRRAKVRW